MKKTLSTILLGASLFFGAGDKTKAQECQTYNHDNDDFSEEIICWKEKYLSEEAKQNKAGSKVPHYKRYEGGIAIIHYHDKDNDNFHESIRVFNFNKLKFRGLIIEKFYIDKNTGLINYNLKSGVLTKKRWDKYYAGKSFINSIRENLRENLYYESNRDYLNLTKEDLYNMGIGERVKKIINASKDETELKNLVSNERDLLDIHYGF